MHDFSPALGCMPFTRDRGDTSHVARCVTSCFCSFSPMMSQSFHRFPRRRARMPERTAGLVEHFFSHACLTGKEGCLAAALSRRFASFLLCDCATTGALLLSRPRF